MLLVWMGVMKIDFWVDIDGGIGVLFFYFGKGCCELLNSRVYVDGLVELFLKDGFFFGCYVYMILFGVVV